MGHATASSRSTHPPAATAAGSLNSKHLLAALLFAATLPATATASFLSSPLNAIKAPRAYSGTPRTLPSSSSPTYSNTSQSVPFVNDTSASTVGRYGHAAIYLEAAQKILFVGGQVGSEGTQITTDVLEFDLQSSLLWGDRPISAIPNNPSSIPATSLPAHAWASSALDSQSRTWLLGGVTEDCATNPVAYVLGSDGIWSSPTLSPRAPPRRRQAATVSVTNSSTSGIDLFVFGGIADKFTCSEGTIGYRGIDRYNTVTGEVEIFGWTAPTGATSDWEPPVSDATATVLEDGGSVAIVGGQTASGVLVELSSILVFDVDTRSWTAQPATGDIPSPRMGHVAIPLGSDQIILHGGLGANQQPFADVHLLSPSSDLSESWTWTTLSISDHSLEAPSRAWHSATLTSSGQIVVAFGMDTLEGEPSAEFFFLSFDEQDGTYTWTQTFEVESSAEDDQIATVSAPVVHAVIVNPKASIDSSGNTVYVSSEAETMSYQAPASTAYTSTTTTPRRAVSTSTATRRSFSRSSSSPSASSTLSAQSLAASEAASKKQKTIAASVGSLVALVAVIGVAALFIRRRNSRKEEEPNTPATFTAPFVSTLLYTRPSKSRMLSLGSTVSAPRSIAESEGLDEPPSSTGHGATLGQAQDPFSDVHHVNEVGQLRPAPQDGGLLSAISPSLASVASIPYLAALTRTRSTASSTQSDSYTSKPPTIGSRRSLRSNAAKQKAATEPELNEKDDDAYGQATPPAAQQEFGVALTSDSPHPGWLDFVKPSSSSSGAGAGGAELFMGSGEMREVSGGIRSSTPGSVGAVVEAGASRTTSRASEQSRRSSVPSVLRPHTPLRVINADPEDPFRDQ